MKPERSFAHVLALTSLVSGCAVESGSSADNASSTEDAVSAGQSTFYIATGYWGSTLYAKRVNRSTSKCASGHYDADCPVENLDLDALGLTSAEKDVFVDAFEAGEALVRGTIAKRNAVATLSATEAWIGMRGVTPSGAYYRLTREAGQVRESKLNVSSHIWADAMQWTGLTEGEKDEAITRMASGELLTVGRNSSSSSGRTFKVSEYYFSFPLSDTCSNCSGQRSQAWGACILHGEEECSSDNDCKIGGCGGELCFNPDLGNDWTSCQCSFPTGVSCGCVQGSCAWYWDD